MYPDATDRLLYPENNPPPYGTVYFVIELEVTNTGTDYNRFSTLTRFAYDSVRRQEGQEDGGWGCDALARSIDWDTEHGVERMIAPGETATGEICFNVRPPADWMVLGIWDGGYPVGTTYFALR